MTEFDVLAVLVSMAAVFAWVNHRWLRLPATIGLLAISLGLSLVLVVLDRLGFAPADAFFTFVAGIDFDEALLNGMLGALLFAGALHVNLESLLRQSGIVALLSTAGVLISTGVVGTLAWLLFGALGFDVPLLYCLLLGAIVSPTDPIAVGAILRKAGVPDSLLAKVSGESLFNDGLGVVVFLVLLQLVAGSAELSAAGIAHLLAVEVLGGLAYGAVVGWLAYRMLRSVDHYSVEIMVTLALVTGGYALAHHLHVSAPLAMVVAGLLLGNRGRTLAMSETTRRQLDGFWELVDEFLNAVLFVLIGVEVVALDFSQPVLLAGVLCIPVALAARWVSVAVPLTLLGRLRRFSPHALTVLTWSGLKGGISVALALSLPADPSRGLVVTATYLVVCFSILVQGLTVGPLVEWLMRTRTKPA